MKLSYISIAIALLMGTAQVAIANETSLTPPAASPLAIERNTSDNMKRVVHQKDMLSLLAADGSARLVVHQHQATEIGVHFSALTLALGSYLEVSSPSRKEVHVYNAHEIKHALGYKGFTTATVTGDTVVVRIVYPGSLRPNGDDRAKLAAYTYKESPPPGTIQGKTDDMEWVACIRETLPQAYESTHSIGRIAGGTGWLLGAGNYGLSNHHVLGEAGPIPGHALLLNEQFADCQPKTKPENIVKIKGGEILRSASRFDDGGDFALFTLDPLEYREAAVAEIFGGLKVSDQLPQVGEPVYTAGHGEGAPKRITTTEGGDACKIVNSDQFRTYFNCDTVDGTSGSPLISATTHEVVALTWGSAKASNVGTPGTHVISLIEDLVPEVSTAERIGTGKVRSSYLEFPPFDKPVGFKFNETGLSFASFHKDRLEHLDGYSRLRAIGRATTGEEQEIFFRLAKHDACGTHNLDQQSSSCASADSSDIDMWVDPRDNNNIAEDTVVEGWAPLRVLKDGDLVTNQLSHFQYANYDPYKSPFVHTDQEVLTGKVTAEQPGTATLHEAGFGFAATRIGQGPSNIEWNPRGAYAQLFVPVKNRLGEERVVQLRAVNETPCIVLPMNGSQGCKEPTGTLKVFYDKADNQALPSGHYKGILPIMARDFYEERDSKPILIEVDLDLGAEVIVSPVDDKNKITVGELCEGIDEWSPKQYRGGSKVQRNGHEYVSRWSTEPHHQPGVTGWMGEPWTDNGLCQ